MQHPTTARARIWSTIWAAWYLARITIRYRFRWSEIIHHVNVEHRHLVDQAEAGVSYGAASGGGGGRSGDRPRGQRRPGR